MRDANNRIAYVINNVAFFTSHRLPLAVHAQKLGWEVALFVGQPGSISIEEPALALLNEVNVPYERVSFRSAGVNPLIEAWGLLKLIFLLRCYKPDIVHCVSPKGVLYGGIATRFIKVRGVVLAVSGMGYAFTSSDRHNFIRSLIRLIYKIVSRLAFNHARLRVIVQNADDLSSIVKSNLVQIEKVVLIPGSGVNFKDFVDYAGLSKEKIVLLPARILRDKGVVEFVNAARQLRRQAPDWRFILAGAADYKNPSAIPLIDINAWVREGVVEWLGHVQDMPSLYAKVAIVCLPSYREGMPKVLLEAAVAGCAVVTTDVIGCREAILDGETGDLVPVRNVDALRQTLLALMLDEPRRTKYGIKGRKRALQNFSAELIVKQTFDIYREFLKDD